MLGDRAVVSSSLWAVASSSLWVKGDGFVLDCTSSGHSQSFTDRTFCAAVAACTLLLQRVSAQLDQGNISLAVGAWPETCSAGTHKVG